MNSKTISWHAAFPVRFARRLAALRLNSPLRGSDSGSLGRQHRKPHDGSLATVRAICFCIHHGCIILRTMFFNAVRLHIAKSSWSARSLLSGTVFQAKLQNTKKQRHCNGSKFPSLCLCLFCFVHKKVDAKGCFLPACKIWYEVFLKTMAIQKRTAMCKMNNSQESTFTCPSGNSFICTCNTAHL